MCRATNSIRYVIFVQEILVGELSERLVDDLCGELHETVSQFQTIICDFPAIFTCCIFRLSVFLQLLEVAGIESSFVYSTLDQAG